MCCPPSPDLVNLRSEWQAFRARYYDGTAYEDSMRLISSLATSQRERREMFTVADT